MDSQGISLDDISRTLDQAREAVNSVIIGQAEVVDQILAGYLARGHILLEGVPGTAKTLLVRVLSAALGVHFGRVQFTPDLMPSDITGVSVYSEKSRDFEFRKGPLFTDILLADEINRAPAKTQAALLEAMQERQVTVDSKTYMLSDHFTVLATQNPIEYEGTYPLPEAQLDRFLINVRIDYPSRESELGILDKYADGFDAEQPQTFQNIARVDSLHTLYHHVQSVTVAQEIREYITDIVRASREDSSLLIGASPRASVSLFKIARASALLNGRDYVVPDDVKEFAIPVLRHRVTLAPELQVDGRSADDIISSILSRVTAPK